jgi:hypothetical protein
MTFKKILWAAACLICIAIGFVLAQQYERRRADNRIEALQQQHAAEVEQARSDAEARVDAMARSQGETLAQTFAAGISQAVLSGRREGVEIAAVGLLHVPGIAGVHVLETSGAVIYSSDAKLATTGEGAYRGAWALQATEKITQPSARPNVIDIAVPITNGTQTQAIVWLEYDLAAVKAAANAQPQAPAQQPVASEPD